MVVDYTLADKMTAHDRKDYIHACEQSVYYDKLQYVYKIKLNSLYGALSNLFFRFFDRRLGESTTGCGRAVVKHQAAYINYLLSGEYDFEGEHIVAGDTDSCYFTTGATKEHEAIIIADECAKAVNSSFAKFAKQHFFVNDQYASRIACNREVVGSRAIFVKKKNYAIHVIDSEGAPTNKVKIMGLMIKKTVIPKPIGIQLSKFLQRLLTKDDWPILKQDIVEYKNMLYNTNDISLLGLPKGVRNVEDYTEKFIADPNTRLPGHVAAAIHYNICLDAHKDKRSIPITSGMKIRVFYIKQPVGRFTSIALPADLEDIPKWFDNNIIDRDKHIPRLIDNPFDQILTAIGKRTPSKLDLYVENAFEY